MFNLKNLNILSGGDDGNEAGGKSLKNKLRESVAAKQQNLL